MNSLFLEIRCQSVVWSLFAKFRLMVHIFDDIRVALPWKKGLPDRNPFLEWISWCFVQSSFLQVLKNELRISARFLLNGTCLVVDEAIIRMSVAEGQPELASWNLLSSAKAYVLLLLPEQLGGGRSVCTLFDSWTQIRYAYFQDLCQKSQSNRIVAAMS